MSRRWVPRSSWGPPPVVVVATAGYSRVNYRPRLQFEAVGSPPRVFSVYVLPWSQRRNVDDDSFIATFIPLRFVFMFLNFHTINSVCLCPLAGRLGASALSRVSWVRIPMLDVARNLVPLAIVRLNLIEIFGWELFP